MTKHECCAITSDLYQKQSVKQGFRNVKCTRQARFEYEDKFYCREHVALIVLQKFEEEGKVRRV